MADRFKIRHISCHKYVCETKRTGVIKRYREHRVVEEAKLFHDRTDRVKALFRSGVQINSSDNCFEGCGHHGRGHDTCAWILDNTSMQSKLPTTSIESTVRDQIFLDGAPISPGEWTTYTMLVFGGSR